MNYKKLINWGTLITVIIILVSSIIYYFLNHSALRADRKFDFSYDWFLIICDIFIFIIILTGLYEKWKNNNLYMNIIFKTSSPFEIPLVFTRIFIFCVFIFGIFVYSINPSSIELSTSFCMAMVFINFTTRQMMEDAIREKGVSYFGNFYFWENIKSYKINEKGSSLKIKYSKRVLFFKNNGSLDMIIKEKDKVMISEFLDLKLNN